MVNIKLKDGQSGYEVVEFFIRRYWEHNIIDTVIVSINMSRDGEIYEKSNEIAIPIIENDDIEFLFDWWEGEKYINILGIKSINEVEISGGIYA